MPLYDWESNDIWKPFVINMYNAINLLPVCQEEIYRCVDVKFNSKDYQVDPLNLD